jgi:superfamily II DNA or RNA helicase
LETRLRYQVEALEWALETLEERSGPVIHLPTGTGNTLVGVAFAERVLKEGLNVLVWEPTRFLVE